MRHKILLFALLLTLLPTIGTDTALATSAPFNRGFNLTGWLQSSGPRAVHFTRLACRICGTYRLWAPTLFGCPSIYTRWPVRRPTMR